MTTAEYGTTHTAIRFTPDEMQRFRDDFADGSWVGSQYPEGSTVLGYDTAAFPFAGRLSDLLVAKGIVTREALEGIPGLEYLHTLLPDSMKDLDVNEVNETTRRFYEQDEAFLAVYHAFIKDFCDRFLATECVVQRTPTIRFHFPHQRGFNWAPRYHTDLMLGHPPQEVNLWIPLVDVHGSNSLRMAPLAPSLDILHRYDLDFHAFAVDVQHNGALKAELERISWSLDLKYGEYALFDSRALHACQYNTTETTRISIDVRVIPTDRFARRRVAYKGTGRLQMPFEQGNYYDSRTSVTL